MNSSNTNYDKSFFDNLKQLRDKSREIMNSEGDFNERFNKSWKLEEPLRNWVIKEFYQKMNDKNMSSKELLSLIQKMDTDCARTFQLQKENNWTDEKRTAKCKEISTFYENEELRIAVVLDYDCDTTLCKIFCTNKKYDFFFRNSIDLGRFDH